MNEVRQSSYQFQFKQTWFGIVLMFRCAEPFPTAKEIREEWT